MSSTDQYDIPEGVDEAAIARMNFVARALDDSVRIPGIGVRVGLDPILGIVPGAGDAVATGLSMYIVAESARLGVSWPTLLRMMGNVGVDTASGLVPVAGDVFDVFWKANRWNLELALADLEGQTERASGHETAGVTIDVE